MLTCFTCKFPTLEEWAERVSTRPAAAGTRSPYFPFLTQIQLPQGAIVEADGSALVCAFCHASLLSQWKRYERHAVLGVSENEWSSRGVYSLGKFICGVCGVTTYRKRIRTLSVQEFPFLASQRPKGSLTFGNNLFAVVCLDCFETLRSQNEEYDRWGFPLQRRKFNWLAREPPDPSSPEAAVARLPCGKTKLPSSPPTEPVITTAMRAPVLEIPLKSSSVECHNPHSVSLPSVTSENLAHNSSRETMTLGGGISGPEIINVPSDSLSSSYPSLLTQATVAPASTNSPRAEPYPRHRGCRWFSSALSLPRAEFSSRVPACGTGGSHEYDVSSSMGTTRPQVLTSHSYAPLENFSVNNPLPSLVKRRRSIEISDRQADSLRTSAHPSCPDPLGVGRKSLTEPLMMIANTRNNAMRCISQPNVPNVSFSHTAGISLPSSTLVHGQPESNSPYETILTCKMRDSVLTPVTGSGTKPYTPSRSMTTTTYSEKCMPIRKRRSGYGAVGLKSEGTDLGVGVMPKVKWTKCGVRGGGNGDDKACRMDLSSWTRNQNSIGSSDPFPNS